MVRSCVLALVIIVAASTSNRADPNAEPKRIPLWIGVDLMGNGFATDRGTWSGVGAGLAARYQIVWNLELGVEGQVLRLDAIDMTDDRHGFALRGAITAGYGIPVSRWSHLDWRVGPELGIGSLVLAGIGTRTADEMLVGVRASVRGNDEPSKGASGFGVHFGIRVTRTDGSLGGAFLIGHDWGQ